MNRDRHIWEGWTVGDFIDEIEPIFNMKLKVIQHPWFSESALKKWVKDEQPYYKKHIPEVYEYFLTKIKF